METLWNNLKQGLKNYCDKNGFKKVILGLSGGLDSAICAVLAADVLGGKNVTAIMMKTKYTSDLSLKIAREISKQNNLNYHEIDIDPFFEHETDLLKNAFKEDVKGIVQENLQTCGGLAPIGNVYKTTIFELAKWRNTLSKALPQEVITRAPSAELAEGQKDENTLPPYSVLDPILKELYDNKQTIEQTVSKGFDKQTVERVQNLITRSAFKRKQMAEMIEI